MTRAPARPTLPLASADLEGLGVRELLERSVEEAARLLNADGAMVYLVDAQHEQLRFAVDAGIRNAEAQELIRGLSLPVGVGLFGHAVTTAEVVVSGVNARSGSDRKWYSLPLRSTCSSCPSQSGSTDMQLSSSRGSQHSTAAGRISGVRRRDGFAFLGTRTNRLCTEGQRKTGRCMTESFSE